MNTRLNGEGPSAELLEELEAVAESEAVSTFRAHGVIELRAFLETEAGQRFVFDVWHRNLTLAIEKACDEVIAEVVIPAMKETLREPGFKAMLLELVRGQIGEATVGTLLSLPTRLEKMAKRISRRAR